MPTPYDGAGPEAFWRTAVVEGLPSSMDGIYRRKWPIAPDCPIGTAGSCFAQHVSRVLRTAGFNVIDVEPPPEGLPSDRHRAFGFSTYSARYGNIYTMRQLRQLAQEVVGMHVPGEVAWEKAGRWYDALRPGVEPEGLDSPDEVRSHRAHHLEMVAELFRTMELFVFTLGLTEATVHRATGTVFPTAPGTIAGAFDPERYVVYEFGFDEVIRDFHEFQEVIRRLRGGPSKLRFLLTVSPVPLTATVSGRHVLTATAHSKSVLRAVAGHLARKRPNVDYFPAYEIVTNPAARSTFYEANLRTIRPEGVDAVMNVFLAEHGTGLGVSSRVSVPATRQTSGAVDDDVACEDAMIEAFGP